MEKIGLILKKQGPKKTVIKKNLCIYACISFQVNQAERDHRSLSTDYPSDTHLSYFSCAGSLCYLSPIFQMQGWGGSSTFIFNVQVKIEG
jgi:hypothetical protein